MIYIVEIPNKNSPRAWARMDKDDIISYLNEYVGDSDIIYMAATGRQLLQMYDFEDTQAMYKEGLAEDSFFLQHLSFLIAEVGLDTMMYKTFNKMLFDKKPIDRWETYLDYNKRYLSMQKVYMTDEEAIAAVKDDSEWNFPKGDAARNALKKLLDQHNV